MKIRSAWPLFLLITSFAACSDDEVVRGNGRLVETKRSVAAFSAVSISDGLNADVSPGSPSLTLLFDDNLAGLVGTDVTSGTLEIEPHDGYSLLPSPSAVATIQSPRVERLEASGQSSLTGTTNGRLVSLAAAGNASIAAKIVDAANVAIDASGTSRVRIAGTSPSLAVAASGHSTVESDAPAEIVEIAADGASAVRVRASKSVRVRTSGSSAVTIVGKPGSRDVETSGTSTVTFAE